MRNLRGVGDEKQKRGEQYQANQILVGDDDHGIVFLGQFPQEKHIANGRQNRAKGQYHPKCAYGGVQKGRKQHDENTCEGHKYAEHVEPGEILFEIEHGEKRRGNRDGGHNDGYHRGVAMGETVCLADKIEKWLKTAESENSGDVLAVYLHVFAEE